MERTRWEAVTPVSRYCPGINLKHMWEITENLKDSEHPSQDSNSDTSQI